MSEHLHILLGTTKNKENKWQKLFLLHIAMKEAQLLKLLPAITKMHNIFNLNPPCPNHSINKYDVWQASSLSRSKESREKYSRNIKKNSEYN